MRLIDADALLNRMRKDPLFDLVERYGVSGVINAEPTVDAVPVRHGKWLCSDDMYETAVCSVCNFDTGEPYECVKKSWNFCPNCGAKMDGERKEE